MSMLRQYGPSVPDGTLRRLVLAFGELRTMADQGMITYPYSTREVVNMVKHLEVSSVRDVNTENNSSLSVCRGKSFRTCKSVLHGNHEHRNNHWQIQCVFFYIVLALYH